MILFLQTRSDVIAPVAAISPTAWYYLGLSALVLALAFSINWAYRVWSAVHEKEDPATPDELMEAFEEARAAGELDDEEYDRVRKRIQQAGFSPPPRPRAPRPESEE